MAHSYTSLWYHLVWSTKYRQPLLEKAWRWRLYDCIRHYCQYKGYHFDCANGVEDHVHVLVSLKPTLAISDVIRNIKTHSYFWVRENIPNQEGFGWQDGYAAFSVGERHISALRRYIYDQERHHQRLSFLEEYKRLRK